MKISCNAQTDEVTIVLSEPEHQKLFAFLDDIMCAYADERLNELPDDEVGIAQQLRDWLRHEIQHLHYARLSRGT